MTIVSSLMYYTTNLPRVYCSSNIEYLASLAMTARARVSQVSETDMI